MELRRNFEGGACWVGNKVPLSCKGRGKIEKTRSTWHDIILSKLKTRATQSFVILGIEFSFPLQLTSSNQIGPLPPPNVTAVGADVADVKFNIRHTTSASLMSHPLLQTVPTQSFVILGDLVSAVNWEIDRKQLGLHSSHSFSFQVCSCSKTRRPFASLSMHPCMHPFIYRNNGRSKCLDDSEGNPLETPIEYHYKLPGEIVSADEQCKYQYGNTSSHCFRTVVRAMRGKLMLYYRCYFFSDKATD